MRYSVEFEMRSDLHHTVSESVRKILVSTFGSIDKFTIVPCREYIGYIRRTNTLFGMKSTQTRSVNRWIIGIGEYQYDDAQDLVAACAQWRWPLRN